MSHIFLYLRNFFKGPQCRKWPVGGDIQQSHATLWCICSRGCSNLTSKRLYRWRIRSNQGRKTQVPIIPLYTPTDRSQHKTGWVFLEGESLKLRCLRITGGYELSKLSCDVVELCSFLCYFNSNAKTHFFDHFQNMLNSSIQEIQ